jgi:hypothetical protein
MHNMETPPPLSPPKNETLIASQVEDASPAPNLDRGQQEYLLSRHGTLHLSPLPSASPDDPLNWPAWKKNSQMLMVAFHAMMCLVAAAGIIPAFEDFAKEYKRPIEDITYLTGAQVIRHR